MRKNKSFCNHVLIYTLNNVSMVLEIIIIKFSCIFKMMSRNTFPEPQPDSASYSVYLHSQGTMEILREFLESSTIHSLLLILTAKGKMLAKVEK